MQEEFVESEAAERASQRTVSIMKDIGSQLPEDQREGERDCRQKHLPSSVRKEVDRPRADLTPSVWKPER